MGFHWRWLVVYCLPALHPPSKTDSSLLLLTYSSPPWPSFVAAHRQHSLTPLHPPHSWSTYPSDCSNHSLILIALSNNLPTLSSLQPSLSRVFLLNCMHQKSHVCKLGAWSLEPIGYHSAAVVSSWPQNFLHFRSYSSGPSRSSSYVAPW